MLKDTYDVTGFKYGISIDSFTGMDCDFAEKCIMEGGTTYFEELLKNRWNSASMIMYSSIDGLSVSEILDYSFSKEQDYIMFFTYDEVECNIGNGYDYKLRDAYIISRNEQNKDQEISSVIGKYLIEKYEYMGDASKRRAKCFLQRYVYGTKEETDKHLFSKEKVYQKVK